MWPEVRAVIPLWKTGLSWQYMCVIVSYLDTTETRDTAEYLPLAPPTPVCTMEWTEMWQINSNSSSPFTWEPCRWCEICKRSHWVAGGVVLQINWLLQEQLANTSGQPRAGAKCEAVHKNNIHITRQEARGACQMSDVRCQMSDVSPYQSTSSKGHAKILLLVKRRW